MFLDFPSSFVSEINPNDIKCLPELAFYPTDENNRRIIANLVKFFYEIKSNNSYLDSSKIIQQVIDTLYTKGFIQNKNLSNQEFKTVYYQGQPIDSFDTLALILNQYPWQLSNSKEEDISTLVRELYFCPLMINEETPANEPFDSNITINPRIQSEPPIFIDLTDNAKESHKLASSSTDERSDTLLGKKRGFFDKKTPKLPSKMTQYPPCDILKRFTMKDICSVFDDDIRNDFGLLDSDLFQITAVTDSEIKNAEEILSSLINTPQKSKKKLGGLFLYNNEFIDSCSELAKIVQSYSKETIDSKLILNRHAVLITLGYKDTDVNSFFESNPLPHQIRFLRDKSKCLVAYCSSKFNMEQQDILDNLILLATKNPVFLTDFFSYHIGFNTTSPPNQSIALIIYQFNLIQIIQLASNLDYNSLHFIIQKVPILNKLGFTPKDIVELTKNYNFNFSSIISNQSAFIKFKRESIDLNMIDIANSFLLLTQTPIKNPANTLYSMFHVENNSGLYIEFSLDQMPKTHPE